MSKKANSKIIGTFVLGAVVLTVAGIMIFSTDQFLKKKEKYVLYFQESVKGLSVGAPVKFMGVRVGQVTDIQVHMDRKKLTYHIPVFIEVFDDKFYEFGEFGDIDYDKMTEEEIMEHLIEDGLRGQLQLMSLVTGQLFVQIGFFPDKPARLVHLQSVGRDFVEVPTIQSPFEQISQTLENLDVQELVTEALQTLRSIEKVMNAPELMESMSALKETLNNAQQLVKNAQQLVKNVDARVDPLASDIEDTVKDTRNLVRHADTFVQNADGKVAELKEDTAKTMKKARTALEQANKTLANVEDTFSERAELRYRINLVLQEITVTARSIRVLADYLQQNPDALIYGKGKKRGD